MYMYMYCTCRKYFVYLIFVLFVEYKILFDTNNFPNYGNIHTCTCMYLYDELHWQCLPYTGWFWRWQDRRFAVEFLWQRRWWGGFVSYSTTKHCFVVWQSDAMGWTERNERLLLPCCSTFWIPFVITVILDCHTMYLTVP